MVKTSKMVKFDGTYKGFKKAARKLRRRARKKATRLNNTIVLGKGFPKKMVVTHKYSEIITLTGTSGAMGSYQFSCNGLYDPNITGIGHQPYYFDQLTALYNHYCVIGSKFTAKFTPISAAQPATMVCLFINDDTSVTGAAIDTQEELGTARWKVVPNSTTVPMPPLRVKWSAKKYFGKSVLANTDLQGTVSANPTEQSYFTLCIGSMDKINTTSCYVEVIIEYIAVWKELKDIASS